MAGAIRIFYFEDKKGLEPEGRDRRETVRWTVEQGAVQAARKGRRRTADTSEVLWLLSPSCRTI